MNPNAPAPAPPVELLGEGVDTTGYEGALGRII